MKKLKYLNPLLLTLIWGFNFLIAQPQHRFPNSEERAARTIERLKFDLNLSEKQIEQVSEVVLKYAKKGEEMRDKSEDRSKIMQNMKKLALEQDKDLKKILTNEQFKKYEKIMEENRNRMRRRE